jgi:hypothetical protein
MVGLIVATRNPELTISIALKVSNNLESHAMNMHDWIYRGTSNVPSSTLCTEVVQIPSPVSQKDKSDPTTTPHGGQKTKVV